ncbi:STAS domain-containing protein [Pseudonocardia sulfidoxydans]|uniref:STAS domain-containing protein n=1 Tax=Pseudonocardia sulfidoxydans TaxID=54011 RepID=UPI0011BDB5F1|nr:STAS domain-containing protein [Pseudonocardia sulfidoxydans]
MHSTFTIQLAVERSPRGHVVRAAGELSARTGGRLVRLVDKLVDGTPRPAGPRALVIDLAQIRSFDTDGVEALRRAHGRARSAGVGLCLTRLEGRRALLPHDVDGLLDRLPVVGSKELIPAEKPRRLAVSTA